VKKDDFAAKILGFWVILFGNKTAFNYGKM